MADKTMELHLPAEVSSGSYSNIAVISHTRMEFVFDFAHILPGIAGPEVNSRIIMTPENAKKVLEALQDNIIRYESVYGNIPCRGEATEYPIQVAPPGRRS